MSRQGALVGVALATVFGVATAYATLTPELVKLKAEREGKHFGHEHGTAADHDTIISRGIASDLDEASEQVQASGFAWGIRQALLGKNAKTSAKEKEAARQDGQKA